MALSTRERDILDSSNPDLQGVALGTEIYAIQHGQGITLPTSDPGVAGYLWNSSNTVTVSAG